MKRGKDSYGNTCVSSFEFQNAQSWMRAYTTQTQRFMQLEDGKMHPVTIVPGTLVWEKENEKDES